MRGDGKYSPRGKNNIFSGRRQKREEGEWPGDGQKRVCYEGYGLSKKRKTRISGGLNRKKGGVSRGEKEEGPREAF